MTGQQERTAPYDKLREVLGAANTATIEAMFEGRSDLATKDDLVRLGGELRSEMSKVRNEVAFLRQEMEFKYATKVDLLEMTHSLNQNFHSYMRTFVVAQAATVVGVTSIVYALARFT